MPESRKSMSSCGGNRSLAASDAQFIFHSHRYFPYERELAQREIEHVLSGKDLEIATDSITAKVDLRSPHFKRLTYFSEIRYNGTKIRTAQHRLEESFRESQGRRNRQITRYSVHGIHEYKGKFNPQLARFILNYFGAEPYHRVLDPFCGSGTTLVEAAFQNVKAVGVDMNPLAVFLTNSKLTALGVCADELERLGSSIVSRLKKCPPLDGDKGDLRVAYLKKWFPRATLALIEHLKAICDELPEWARNILLSLGSNLIRDYSLQEPADLRIRRRMSPFPEVSFQDAFQTKLVSFCAAIRASQDVLGQLNVRSKAICGDARQLAQTLTRDRVVEKFDFVVTSPPYATALPYIDMQRLSLVWLGLCSAKEIAILEADAVGSRELKGPNRTWAERLASNTDKLPAQLGKFCRTLQNAVSKTDGFRRKAAPQLIYRYYVDMLSVFKGLANQMKTGARLGFVVGSNHTTLGGKKFIIDTPGDLSVIANECGFCTSEVIRLDTYQRYGLHARNAVNAENLTVFEKH